MMAYLLEDFERRKAVLLRYVVTAESITRQDLKACLDHSSARGMNKSKFGNVIDSLINEGKIFKYKKTSKKLYICSAAYAKENNIENAKPIARPEPEGIDINRHVNSDHLRLARIMAAG